MGPSESIGTRIFVCVNQVVDWERSTRDFRIDPANDEPRVSVARYCIDQYDEIAVEVALKARACCNGSVHAVSVGPENAEDTLKHVLSMKADSAALIVTSGRTDTARLLCAAIRRKGDAAIVLCGRVSSDNGTASTAPRLAEMLARPCITHVIGIKGEHEGWLVTRETARGHDELLVRVPFVATVTNAKTNIPRSPTMKDKMWAYRQQVEIVPCADLDPEAGAQASGERLQLIQRQVPVSARACHRIDGDARQQAHALAQYVRKVVPRVS